ncbi:MULTISPECIES: lecithin retinol acyltransferase family protein [unclassified Variovorax]
MRAISKADTPGWRSTRTASSTTASCRARRAHQSVGRTPPYDLWNRNCEHYATWLMGEKPQSPQVNGAVVLGLLGTVLWLAK